MSDRLYAAARTVPAERKRVVKIEGASHWGVMSLDPASFGRALSEFVTLATGTAGGAAAPSAAASATASRLR
jgi:hypothetical protein